jgi:DNA-binding NtrC family response regulator
MRNGASLVLIVDADAAHARAIGAALTADGARRAVYADSMHDALCALGQTPELIVTELCLPDGDCLPLLRAARRLVQAPLVVAMSAQASRELVANAILEGAELYFEKPVEPQRIAQRLSTVRSDAPAACRRLARLLVGRVGLKEAQEQLRGSMNFEALERTGGSRRAAAHLLGVDRRYVQRMVQKFAEPRTALCGAAATDQVRAPVGQN